MTTTASRNPFRTERLHSLPFQLQGLQWDDLLDRCAETGFRGAIIGSHGSGKTTLILELARRLRDAGHSTAELFTNADADFNLPADWRSADRNSVVIADGYDSLHIANRLWMRRRYPRLIVTSHRACALPTLYCCEAQADVLAWAVGELTGEEISHEAADTLLTKHGRNMRDALRYLYETATSEESSALERLALGVSI